MEITVNIDGKEVPFKSSGAVAPRYMMQFQRDLLKDMMKMGISSIDFENATEQELMLWARDNIDFMVFYNIAWTFAKTADPTIPEPMKWLDSFETFPIFKIMEPIQDLLALTFSGTKEVKEVKEEEKKG